MENYFSLFTVCYLVMDYVVLDSPELSDVVELIKKYSRTHVIILYLNCEVVYDGRARSRLSFGNRIFHFKARRFSSNPFRD